MGWFKPNKKQNNCKDNFTDETLKSFTDNRQPDPKVFVFSMTFLKELWKKKGV